MLLPVVYSSAIRMKPNSADDHKRHLLNLLDILSKERLYLNNEKSHYFCKYTRYLGAVCGDGVLLMCPSKPAEGADESSIKVGGGHPCRRLEARHLRNPGRGSRRWPRTSRGWAPRGGRSGSSCGPLTFSEPPCRCRRRPPLPPPLQGLSRQRSRLLT